MHHTREAESIGSRTRRRMPACLLFSSRGNKSKRANAIAHRLTSAERDLHFVRDWSEERAGRRNKMVRGCRAGRQIAEVGRLLAYEIGGRDSAPEADAGDRLRAL